MFYLTKTQRLPRNFNRFCIYAAANRLGLKKVEICANAWYNELKRVGGLPVKSEFKEMCL